MLISLNWIKKYLDLPADLSVEQLAYDLTMSTVEVEGVHDLAAGLDKVLVGRVLQVLRALGALRLARHIGKWRSVCDEQTCDTSQTLGHIRLGGRPGQPDHNAPDCARGS